MAMILRYLHTVRFPILLSVIALGNAWFLQEPGIAEITTPTAGNALAGLIVIEGTADHPAFTDYELFFGFEGLETLSWFPVGERNFEPVRGAPLGIWDTTQITDGDYRLRLVVLLDDGRTIEHTVGSLRVRNIRPIETDTPAPEVAPAGITPTFLLDLTETPAAVAVSRGPQTGRLLDALAQGALIAILSLGALTGYVWFRRSNRTWRRSSRFRLLKRRERSQRE